MNPLFQNIAINHGKNNPKRKYDPSINKEINEELRKYKIKIKGEILGFFLLSLGIVLAGFGLKSFLLAAGFIDGGITGISLLLAKVTGVSLPLFIILLNLPFIVLGYKQMGLNFAIKTTFGITGLALCLSVVDYPILTNDKLLIAIFGGFFLGAGIGLAIRGGGVLDGTEVMAVYLENKTALSLGDIVLVFNVFIFLVAAYLLSVEVALYSMLTYFAASKTIDFILEGIEEYTGVTIISTRAGEIRKMITEKLGRGVTIYKGMRGYGKTGETRGEIDILFTVITRLEVTNLKMEIEKIDAEAFVTMSSIKETKGGMVKKRALHK